MAKTKKGSRPTHFEYWSNRPQTLNGTTGKEAKTGTHRLERRRNKKETKDELKEKDDE